MVKVGATLNGDIYISLPRSNLLPNYINGENFQQKLLFAHTTSNQHDTWGKDVQLYEEEPAQSANLNIIERL